MSLIVVPTQAIETRANWKTADIAKRTAEWFLQVGDEDVAEIDAAHQAFKARKLPLEAMRKSDFPLPRFSGIAARALDMLENGPGFFLIRGFPVARYSKADARAAHQRKADRGAGLFRCDRGQPGIQFCHRFPARRSAAHQQPHRHARPHRLRGLAGRRSHEASLAHVDRGAQQPALVPIACAYLQGSASGRGARRIPVENPRQDRIRDQRKVGKRNDRHALGMI